MTIPSVEVERGLQEKTVALKCLWVVWLKLASGEKSYPIKRNELIKKLHTELQSFIQNTESWGGLSVLCWLLVNLISLKDLAIWSCRKLLPQWIWCDRGRALRCTDRCLL